ncbi:MAG: hypothetical protein HXY50_00500 [Ignavibacteriaceae bacterium]|nr:hypothetical protein [Ignavibacteriaceae bacterium]
MKKNNLYLEEVYELAIKHSKDYFLERFNTLKSDRTSEFISFRNTRPLKAEIREECNANIYDYCYRNTGRFEAFSKQFSSKEKYAESIAINAVNKSFNKYSKFMNAIEKLENKSKEQLKDLTSAKKRADEMTGKKLKEEKKKVLLKIIKKRTELMKTKSSSHQFSWNCAIEQVYNYLSDEEKRHLLNSDSSENFPIKLNDKRIHRIDQTIRYHQKEDNLPLK